METLVVVQMEGLGTWTMPASEVQGFLEREEKPGHDVYLWNGHHTFAPAYNAWLVWE